jgi:3-oxoacyl-[acyl-carrier-protein] synthase III
MRAQRLPKSKILGTGHYVPEKILTNADLEKMVQTSDAWITERTGVRRRRIAAEGELTSDMAAKAARKALEAAGLTAADLDMIIVGTITADSPMPACAVHVQQKIGAQNIPSFDLAAACGGFLFALNVADQFISTGAARYVLVIGAEMLSRVTNWEDRMTCVLFGDGAGAVVLGPSNGDGRGLLGSRIFTDGSLAAALVIPGGGTAEPLTAEHIANKRYTIHMQGKEVFRTAVKYLVSAATSVLEQAGVQAAEVDWVVPHQANLRILAQVADRMAVPMNKFVVNIQEYGNTSSASVPIALDEAVRDGRIKPGQTVLMVALGAGISWGAALLRM